MACWFNKEKTSIDYSDGCEKKENKTDTKYLAVNWIPLLSIFKTMTFKKFIFILCSRARYFLYLPFSFYASISPPYWIMASAPGLWVWWNWTDQRFFMVDIQAKPHATKEGSGRGIVWQGSGERGGESKLRLFSIYNMRVWKRNGSISTIFMLRRVQDWNIMQSEAPRFKG